MAQYAFGLPYPKIIDFVDIDSQKWKLFAPLVSFPRSILYRYEATRLAQYESLIANNFDYCLVTSDYEKNLHHSHNNIVSLRNGVDLQHFTPIRNITDDTIIFTGAMNYLPNVDAVMYFQKEIFPMIKREIPTAKFIIVGMSPSAAIRALADDATLVTGFVPDIRRYLSCARVCVAPLRLAKGVQNKILEAMAMEIPVVATSAANRGIGAIDQQEIIIADDPKAFAIATIQLLKEQNLGEAIAANAKKFVLENFSWDKNLCKLDVLICDAIRNYTSRRSFFQDTEESRV